MAVNIICESKDKGSIQIQGLDHPLRGRNKLFIRVLAKMLAIPPKCLARIAKLPRATAFDPVTTFLFGDRKSAFRIKTLCHLVSLDVGFYVICLLGIMCIFCVFCYLHLYLLMLAFAIMSQIQALGAI